MSTSIDVLRCPSTGHRLHADGARLVSEDGNHSYPVVEGVPILIDGSASLFRADEIASVGRLTEARRPGVRAAIRRFLPSSTINVNAEARYQMFGRLVKQMAGDRNAEVLVVGGGELGKGMTKLMSTSALKFTETDVYLGPRVDVVCDGHQLPFANHTFDGVIIQAVLEHVLEPSKVVGEIHRVLRKDGIVYAETPFMQQVHQGAFDFTRFTVLGHRRLFRMFSEIERGVAVGPASALVWSLRYFAASLPRRSRLAARALDGLMLLGTFWIKYLDRILVTHPGAYDAASGVYFIGSKAEVAISDADLIASYVGTLGPVAAGSGLVDH